MQILCLNFKRKNMNYPKKLLQDIYWSFSIGEISNISTFINEIENYHKAISGKKLPLKWDEIIFDSPRLELQYVKYTKDDIEEPFELIQADNGINLSAKELLFKIHKIGINLKNDDNCFFEGLTFSGEENEGVPIYFLDTGS